MYVYNYKYIHILSKTTKNQTYWEYSASKAHTIGYNFLGDKSGTLLVSANKKRIACIHTLTDLQYVLNHVIDLNRPCYNTVSIPFSKEHHDCVDFGLTYGGLLAAERKSVIYCCKR